MDASKLTIHPDHLRFKPMAHSKKLELRRENIKALIRSKPAGTRIDMKDFAKVTGTDPHLTASMIKTMVKRKEIIKIPMWNHAKRYNWAVANDYRVKKPANLPETTVQLVKPDTAFLADQAMKFVWEKDSDSLREFVKWLEAKSE